MAVHRRRRGLVHEEDEVETETSKWKGSRIRNEDYTYEKMWKKLWKGKKSCLNQRTGTRCVDNTDSRVVGRKFYEDDAKRKNALDVISPRSAWQVV